ncbi:hypothetical protein GE061_015168 [Apolygus lucorum]|uniref:Uncharacterized protein n=1 Tax=Apolygus lucorum TaxID=248454 RepID=A0A8S9XMA0_APOLU|nr:hypothetical protein GE061_015168 [Apolygus lucorum]
MADVLRRCFKITCRKFARRAGTRGVLSNFSTANFLSHVDQLPRFSLSFPDWISGIARYGYRMKGPR